MAGYGIFEWDEEKDTENAKKHGYPLRFAVHIFADDNHEIIEAKPDPKTLEPRYTRQSLERPRVEYLGSPSPFASNHGVKNLEGWEKCALEHGSRLLTMSKDTSP